MILGIGSDLADIRRFEEILRDHGERFVQRCFSTGEQAALASQSGRNRAAFAAKRWAAKEACAKALGSGIAQGVYLKDIEIERAEGGLPLIKLNGGAEKRLKSLTPPGKQAHIHVSLSDEADMASAFVVISAI